MRYGATALKPTHVTKADDDLLMEALRNVLDQFAAEIKAAVEGVDSRTEFHYSKVYALAGALVLFQPERPDIEQLVITVHLVDGDPPRWEIDATDRESVVFAELEEQTGGAATRRTHEPDAAAMTLQDFLTRVRPAVLEELIAL
jgi:hypothetical protein